MPRSMVGLLLAVVAAAVPILVIDAHGVAIKVLAALAASAGGGIYVLQSGLKKMPRTSRIIL
jgi:hypothetical protein